MIRFPTIERESFLREKRILKTYYRSLDFGLLSMVTTTIQVPLPIPVLQPIQVALIVTVGTRAAEVLEVTEDQKDRRGTKDQRAQEEKRERKVLKETKVRKEIRGIKAIVV
jgi:hypothetical protein